jgi:hypothetical protein
MPDQKGWPDAARPGFPTDPGRGGPHLVVVDKQRRWVWWRPHDDRPGGTWRYFGGVIDGQDPNLDWTYIGPAKAPDGKPVA